ncbi:protein BIG GRAIN 1-like E [Sesbania bispinosa]|nr:protein BIG GRAIN 1-like E [Sesbania bispinosa]
MREERHGHRARISLDMPMRSLLPQQFHSVEKQMKEKKHKQPSSPGGRLASFLNSLFSQSASKKKKSKSSSQSMKDEDESPGGGEGEGAALAISEAQALQIQNHKHAVSLSTKWNGQVKTTTLQNELWDDKKKREPTLLDDSYKHSNVLSEKPRNWGNELLDKDRIWLDKYSAEDKDIRKFNEVDDGAESDSSSDLFELQNYDLGYYSSGLPVYETTNMDNIKRGAPISNGPL